MDLFEHSGKIKKVYDAKRKEAVEQLKESTDISKDGRFKRLKGTSVVKFEPLVDESDRQDNYEELRRKRKALRKIEEEAPDFLTDSLIKSSLGKGTKKLLSWRSNFLTYLGQENIIFLDVDGTLTREFEKPMSFFWNPPDYFPKPYLKDFINVGLSLEEVQDVFRPGAEQAADHLFRRGQWPDYKKWYVHSAKSYTEEEEERRLVEQRDFILSNIVDLSVSQAEQKLGYIEEVVALGEMNDWRHGILADNFLYRVEVLLNLGAKYLMIESGSDGATLLRIFKSYEYAVNDLYGKDFLKMGVHGLDWVFLDGERTVRLNVGKYKSRPFIAERKGGVQISESLERHLFSKTPFFAQVLEGEVVDDVIRRPFISFRRKVKRRYKWWLSDDEMDVKIAKKRGAVPILLKDKERVGEIKDFIEANEPVFLAENVEGASNHLLAVGYIDLDRAVLKNKFSIELEIFKQIRGDVKKKDLLSLKNHFREGKSALEEIKNGKETWAYALISAELRRLRHDFTLPVKYINQHFCYSHNEKEAEEFASEAEMERGYRMPRLKFKTAAVLHKGFLEFHQLSTEAVYAKAKAMRKSEEGRKILLDEGDMFLYGRSREKCEEVLLQTKHLC